MIMIYVGSSLMERDCTICKKEFSFTLAMLTRKAKFKCPHCDSLICLSLDANSQHFEIPIKINGEIGWKDFNSRLN